MRALDINLSAEPYRNDLPIVLVLVALACGVFGLTGWNAYAYFTAGERRAALERELAGHSDRMAKMKQEGDRLGADLKKVDQKVLLSQASFVAGILEQRNFSWTRLFNALEDVVPWNVRLVQIRPSFDKLGHVDIDIDGMARDLDGYFAFQENLLHSDRFLNMIPGDYQRSDADQRVQFRVRATFRPEVPSAAEAAAEGKPVPAKREPREAADINPDGAPDDAAAAAAPAPAPAQPAMAAPQDVRPRRRGLEGSPRTAAPAPQANPDPAQLPPDGFPSNQVTSRRDADDTPPELAPPADARAPQPNRPFPRLRTNPNQPGAPPPPELRKGAER